MRSIIGLIAITLLAQARASAQAPACPEPTVRTVSALQVRITELEGRQRPGFAERCELAQLRLLTGRTDEAASLLEGIIAQQPRSIDAMLALARVHSREQRDSQAEALLQQALRLDRTNVRARIQWASYVAARRAPAEALPLFEQILADQPNDVRALVGTASVYYRLFRDSAAQVLLDRAHARDSTYVPAHLLRAELYVRALNEDARTKAVHRALALDSLSAEAQLAVSRMQRQRNQVDSAYQRLMAVLSFDPVHNETHNMLGNGSALKSWGKYPPLEDNQVPPELARQLDLADSLLIARAFDRAEATFNDVLNSNPGFAAARIGIATVHYYRGDYDGSYRRFLEIAREYPGLGVAHYGVNESVKRIRLLRDPRNAEALARFNALPRPPEPERLREVFTDFDRLDDELQKIVLLSIAPLSNYIPILALTGGTYHLQPFHHRLWQWPATAGSRGRRTFDGRLWDDVKGQGGRNAVAGEEWTREARLERYNVLSHEFMHQVHAQLIPSQRAAIDSLYRSARSQRRTLDSYADSNPQEYLAQVYEAFISPIKDPRLGGTSGNTRERVRTLDPGGYAFVEQINAQPSYLPHALQALQNRARTTRDANLDALERDLVWVRQRYGDHADLGALQAAIYVARNQDFKRAAGEIERYLRVDSSSRSSWLALARYRLYDGDTAGGKQALEQASALSTSADGNAELNLLRAELARLTGDYDDAALAYAAVANESNRVQRTRARAELALLALRSGNPARADSMLQPVRDSSRNDLLVREVEARLLFAHGRTPEAIAELQALRNTEPSRLETIAALLAVARKDRPDLVSALIADARALIARRPAAAIQLDAFAARPGLLSARAIAEFEAEQASLRSGEMLLH